MSAIEINGLTKKYKDVVAVDGLNLRVEKGELFSLLGVNGAGKTTLIKMLCGLVKIDGGNAYLNGLSVKDDIGEIKKIIGISPQETAVASNLTARENLEFTCRVFGYNTARTKAKTDELIKEFDLEKVKNKRAGKLSGGFQRRLSIALALVGEPQILFLDEPTLAVDVIARSELWDKIKSLKGKITVILTTHYMEECEELSDKVGIMADGKLLKVGTTEEIKRETGADTFEKAFIAVVKGGL